MMCFSTIKHRLLLFKRRLVVLFSVFVWFLLLLSASLFVSQHRAGLIYAAPASSLPDLSIYSDSLASGWSNWSWGTTVNFSNTSPTHGGSVRSIAVTYNSAWAGLSLRHTMQIDTPFYQAITFWVHGGSGSAKQLRIRIQPKDHEPSPGEYDFVAPAGVWTPVTVTMAMLGSPVKIQLINIMDRTGGAQGTFYIDQLRLLAAPPASPYANVHIQAGSIVTPFSSYMLASNLPTWLNPTRLANTTFRARTAASGLKLLRLPGGSWSNDYGWLSCEMGVNQPGAEPCINLPFTGWDTWIVRPSHFIAFLKATNTEGMWIVNPNGTSKEAAAAVAFFNGYITDTRTIGYDIRGTNWYTVGRWAALRAAGGHLEPVGIKFWEFGNEVYSSKASHATPSSTGLCVSWAWENTWACDGFEYVNGWGSGSTRREGYLEFRQAMRDVDPTIVVAAVGFEYPGTPSDVQGSTYSGWGSRVISAAGANLDMYSIHPYPFVNLPSSMLATMSRPQTLWSSMMAGIRNAFNTYAAGRQAPIAVTEYNLVAFHDFDSDQWMTRAVNMLFLADSIGQAAQTGAVMFAQWNLANIRHTNGTEYGMMHEDSNYYRAPQYYVYPLWSRFGNQMLPVTSTANAATQLSVYAGRVNSTTLSLLAVNKTDAPLTATITVSNFGPLTGGVAYEVKAVSLGAQSVTYNGSTNPSDTLSEPPASFSASGQSVTRVVPAYSVTLLHLHQSPPPLTPRSYTPIVQR
jgi:alpha-L-arabinofuranosidase